MPAKKSQKINRRKHDIAKEKQDKSHKRKTIVIIALKTLAYILLGWLVYSALKDTSLFKPSNKPSKPTENTSQKEPEMEYDFYYLLPGEKVAGSSNSYPSKQKDLAKTESYVLQVGSFKTMQQAEKLKQKLSNYKFEKILMDKVKTTKSTWYRVSLGPFNSIKQAKESRAELSLKGIHESVIKNWNIR